MILRIALATLAFGITFWVLVKLAQAGADDEFITDGPFRLRYIRAYMYVILGIDKVIGIWTFTVLSILAITVYFRFF